MQLNDLRTVAIEDQEARESNRRSDRQNIGNANAPVASAAAGALLFVTVSSGNQRVPIH